MAKGTSTKESAHGTASPSTPIPTRSAFPLSPCNNTTPANASTIESKAGSLTATIELEKRVAPQAVLLRLRHPQGKRIRQVTVNGKDWRERWRLRLANVFANQIVLIGEDAGEMVAMASGTIECSTQLGYIDLLAVDRRFQGRGYGREMLRGMLASMRERGAKYVYLECLDDNVAGNNLYRAEGFQEVARCVRWFIRLPE